MRLHTSRAMRLTINLATSRAMRLAINLATSLAMQLAMNMDRGRDRSGCPAGGFS